MVTAGCQEKLTEICCAAGFVKRGRFSGTWNIFLVFQRPMRALRFYFFSQFSEQQHERQRELQVSKSQTEPPEQRSELWLISKQLLKQ